MSPALISPRRSFPRAVSLPGASAPGIFTSRRRTAADACIVSNGDGSSSIELTRGLWAIVDDADIETVRSHLWRAHEAEGGCIYAITQVDRKDIRLHNFIMRPPVGFEVDHRDGDGLNNRRSNLRNATRSQNIANRGAQRNNKSGFRGVYLSRGKYWIAQINSGRRHQHLGQFETAEDAACAYDKAASATYGSFARLNFPENQDCGAPSPRDAARLGCHVEA